MPAACSRSRSGGTSAGISTSRRQTSAPSKVRLSAGSGCRRAQRAGALGIGGADVEVRALPIVAHQKGAAMLQPAVQMHDRHPPAVAGGDDAIARLENEAARGRQWISRGHLRD